MKLSNDQLEFISKVVAETVCQQMELAKKKEIKEKQDRRLHNIKLLLKNYRSLVLHCAELKNELDLIDNTSIQDLDVNTINLESIESIKKSKEKSLAMVLFIRNKMQAYKNSCTKDELRYFRVLEKIYLTEKKYTIQEIAVYENIDKVTVYRYLNKAMQELPVVFFGIDAIHFE